MAIQFPDFGRINFSEANPYLAGAQAGQSIIGGQQDILSKMLETQKAQALLPFLKPNAEADLQRKQALLPFLKPQAQANLQQALLKNKWFEPDMKSQIASRNATAENLGSTTAMNRYKLGHPGLLGGSDTKEIQTLMDMGIIPKDLKNGQPQLQQTNPLQTSQNPSQQINPGSPFNTNNPLIDAVLNRKFTQTAYQKKMTEGFNWNHLPVETKNQMVAQGYGMGIDPIKMMNYVNKGMGIQQIAESEGLDPENLPPPIYSPTTATKTRVQQVEQVGHELDYLSSATTPLIKQYADTFAGISSERIKDMVSRDPEAQKRFGRYIGALSVQTGLANGRILLEGGRPGIEVMRMVKESALKGIDQNSPIKMSGIAYQESQDTIDRILQKGAKIRTTTGMNPFSEIGKADRGYENKSQANQLDLSAMSDDELRKIAGGK